MQRLAKIASVFSALSTPKFQERRLIATIVVAMTIMGAIVLTPLWTHRVPVFDDLGAFILPIRTFYACCLAQGDAFDWMPQLFGGFFISGEGQNGFYHPLHLLLYRWIPVDVALNLEFLLSYTIMSVGCVAFLRRYVNLLGAWMGAMLFTFSGEFVHLETVPQSMWILSHIPWILVAMRALIERRAVGARILACVAIALLTASQLLMGHPQTTWFSLLVEGFFALFLLINAHASWGVWAALAAAKLLGVGLAAVQLLATYSVLAASTRAHPPLEYTTSYSLPPVALLGAIAPYLTWGGVPGWLGFYFGAAPLLLGVWWLTAHRIGNAPPSPATGGPVSDDDSPIRWSVATRLSLVAALLSGLTLWLALGSYGKLYYLQTYVPLIGAFRAPMRYLMVVEFGLAIVGAIAFARLASFVKSGQKVDWRHLVLPWLVVGASAFLAAWFFACVPLSPMKSFQGKVYTGPLFLGAVAVALTIAARGRQAGLYALIILGALDLGLHGVAEIRNCWQHCANLSSVPCIV